MCGTGHADGPSSKETPLHVPREGKARIRIQCQICHSTSTIWEKWLSAKKERVVQINTGNMSYALVLKLDLLVRSYFVLNFDHIYI